MLLQFRLSVLDRKFSLKKHRLPRCDTACHPTSEPRCWVRFWCRIHQVVCRLYVDMKSKSRWIRLNLCEDFFHPLFTPAHYVDVVCICKQLKRYTEDSSVVVHIAFSKTMLKGSVANWSPCSSNLQVLATRNTLHVICYNIQKNYKIFGIFVSRSFTIK